jgi:hypothetical protein
MEFRELSKTDRLGSRAFILAPATRPHLAAAYQMRIETLPRRHTKILFSLDRLQLPRQHVRLSKCTISLAIYSLGELPISIKFRLCSFLHQHVCGSSKPDVADVPVTATPSTPHRNLPRKADCRQFVFDGCDCIPIESKVSAYDNDSVESGP